MRLSTLAARNLLRAPGRSLLTVSGVAVAVITFMLLRTVLSAWSAAADHSAKDRLATRHKVTFIMSLPMHYIGKIRAVDGVESATWASWFGGKEPSREDEFFATLAVDQRTFFDVYDDFSITKEEREAFTLDRQGAVVGDVLAKKFGWKKGDRITLRGTIFPGNWDFNVQGVYKATRRSVDRSTFMFHWDYLNEGLPSGFPPDQIGWVVSRIDDASRSAQISQDIDALFEPRDVQTLTMSERDMNLSFMGMMSAVLSAVDVVSIVILAIMALILGNTIAMGVRERTYEYGVLQAIGFLPGHIRRLIVTEGMAVGLAGAGLGLVLGYPFINGIIGRFLEENVGAWFPYFRVPASVLLSSLVLGILLGAVASWIPAHQASKLGVTDALRRVG